MAEFLKHVSLSDKRRAVLDPETNALRDGLSLKEKASASQKGSADVESVEEWALSSSEGSACWNPAKPASLTLVLGLYSFIAG
jgi:hypothetical protein